MHHYMRLYLHVHNRDSLHHTADSGLLLKSCPSCCYSNIATNMPFCVIHYHIYGHYYCRYSHVCFLPTNNIPSIKRILVYLIQIVICCKGNLTMIKTLSYTPLNSCSIQLVLTTMQLSKRIVSRTIQIHLVVFWFTVFRLSYVMCFYMINLLILLN